MGDDLDLDDDKPKLMVGKYPKKVGEDTRLIYDEETGEVAGDDKPDLNDHAHTTIVRCEICDLRRRVRELEAENAEWARRYEEAVGQPWSDG